MALLRLEVPDSQINDAIDQREWRHALQLIEKREKRLKRDETIDWLTACKASIQMLLSEVTKQRQGHALLDTLYQRKPPVVDVTAVMTIEAFSEYRKDSDARLDVLWTQVANANPNNEGLHRYWFKKRLQTKDWQGARKAAMAYMKHFPSKPEPFFWAIFANFMASKSLKTPDQEKVLCGTMAYRMCAKAADDVHAEPGKILHTIMALKQKKELKSGRVLRTPGDVAFLLDVFESQGKWKEAIAVLESRRTGIKSRIGKRSWDLVLRKFQLLEYVGEWLDQFKYSSTLLADACAANSRLQIHGFGEFGNNWSTWVAMLRAAANLRECKVKADDWLSQIAASICTQHAEGSSGRNGMCAKMLLDLSSLVAYGGTPRQGAALLESCCTYFKAYGKKQFCFNDLQIFLQVLDSTMAQSLLKEVKAHIKKEQADLSGDQDQLREVDDLESRLELDANQLIMNVNMLKIEYYLIHSRRVSEKPEDRIALENFVIECINIYHVAVLSYPDAKNAEGRTERLPGDDGGLLAAMGLIRLHALGNRPEALLQAVSLLQHLVHESPFNYEALVTLTALYTKFGAGWLAAEHYSRLSIKNIQYPAISWLLSTRISSIYPYTPQTGYKDPTEKASADPVHHLEQALDYHVHLAESDPEEIVNFLEAGQYASLVHAMGNSAYNQLGFTKNMLQVELARIERLAGVGRNLDYRRLAGMYSRMRWRKMKANTHDAQILYLHKWLSQQAFTALAYDNATKQNRCFPRDDVMNSIIASNDLKESSTPVEDVQIDLTRDLDWISMIYENKVGDAEPRNRNAETVADKFNKMRDWQKHANHVMSAMIEKDGCHLKTITGDTKVPDWEFFHEVYLGLDNCKLVEKTMDVIFAGNRKFRIVEHGFAEFLTEAVRTLCSEYRGIVHAVALQLRESLSHKKHRRSLVYSVVSRKEDTEDKDTIAHWLRRLFTDEQHVQKTLARLTAAWRDALTNIVDLTKPTNTTNLPLQ
ncbi:MAG: hypothetical protein LQ341_001715 [Variospora aurantia]|nr:MAG: hypothetical protein LQ341_001715 [Variospora aurantia]